MYTYVPNALFWYIGDRFSSGRGFSPRSRLKSSSPGQTPRCVLWAFKAVRRGKQSRGRFRPSPSHAGRRKPQISAFLLYSCKIRSSTVTTLASSVPRCYSHGHYFTTMHVWTLLVRVCCVCCACVCPRVCESVNVCVLAL